MSPAARFSCPSPLKKHVALGLFVISALCAPLAHADDYTEVNRLVKAGQTAEALNKAEQYLTSKPRDPQMRFIKGVILAETGKVNEAIGTFTKLTEDYPELPEPYNNLAVLYAGQSQFDKARVALEMAIRTNPSYATAHENLGDVYAKMASQSYSKALQLDSSNTGVPPKLALIRNLFSPDPRASKGTSTPTAAVPAQPLPSRTSATPTAAEKNSTVPTGADVSPDITAAIQAWAKAWAAKDMDAYLAAYSAKFNPGGGKSRKSWEKERHDRIVTKNSITVSVSDISIKVNDDRATASFRQAYRAGSLVSNSRKTLEMAKENGRWLITRENSGG
ncbi:MAG: DUF4440 domain-containing protein [Polaromonas sp.]|nr:DUF4440 domain-containing protein [Polaromonas sp.]